VSSVQEAAANLADEVMEGLGHSAVVLLRNVQDGTQTSVFVSETGDEMLATIASALDQTPELIGLFVNALHMVRREGNSKNDPGFAPVIFVGEGPLN
jgi:hypothetical protein